MTQSTATQMSSERSAGQDAIRPFQVSFSPEDLIELRRRVAATRWPEKEPVADASQGIQLATIQKLAEYWATDYDWSKCEAKLKTLPNFITEIDGLDIHFIHVRSKHENALPLIVTHGWPGSIVEQLKLVGPLTDPTAFGGNAEDAFDLVIPSMAGYGFSGKPTEIGWDTTRMAKAWIVLMERLGYQKYVAQGGDWGAFITEQMGVQAPAELLGIHINLPSAVPPEILKALGSGQSAPAGLSSDESRAYERIAFFFANGLAIFQHMANHPQTLYALGDSPVGLAAWYLDHDLLSYEMIGRAFDGQTEGLTRDDVLDNLTLTWLTNTAVSSARIYRENKLPFFLPMGVKIPVAVSAFPDEIYQAPRSWVEQAYPKLLQYNKAPKGGHFAAWEQPEFLVSELRTAFKTLR
jgi:pimeloyl-ACP methyl ester carboxylesterase